MQALGSGDRTVTSLVKKCVIELFKPDDLPAPKKQTLPRPVPAHGISNQEPGVSKYRNTSSLGKRAPKVIAPQFIAPQPVAAPVFEAEPPKEHVGKAFRFPPGCEGARPQLDNGPPKPVVRPPPGFGGARPHLDNDCPREAPRPPPGFENDLAQMWFDFFGLIFFAACGRLDVWMFPLPVLGRCRRNRICYFPAAFVLARLASNYFVQYPYIGMRSDCMYFNFTTTQPSTK